jgi:hypothetical protein
VLPGRGLLITTGKRSASRQARCCGQIDGSEKRQWWIAGDERAGGSSVFAYEGTPPTRSEGAVGMLLDAISRPDESELQLLAARRRRGVRRPRAA